MYSDGAGQFGLIVIAAPSGAGKSTLCTRLLERLSSRLSLSVSTTSRSPRGSEQNGKEYYFVSHEDFKRKVEAGDFAEWALVHGNYYGTQRKTLQDFWGSNRHVLLDIDVQGMDLLRKTFPDRCFAVFISPPSMEILEQRLRGRGTDSEEAIQKRMKNAVAEMSRRHDFDVVIVNDSFEKAYDELENAVKVFMDELESGKWPRHP
jgi:guanylate kinase